jgi:glucose-1-phosphate adenylyltransferase
MSKRILGVIMGGGVGRRLYPLTRDRSKPAVPFAGKYRLIDIPISNCINSGIERIAVLTQFNSVSLHRHITRTYNFDSFHAGWVQIWAAEQTSENRDWYQGTADAVRKQLLEIRSTRCDDVVVLAGDHLYRMDYAEMLAFHHKKNADITVAVQPVRADDASRFGILRRERDGQLTRFVEKPTDPEVLSEFVSRKDKKRPYLGSMGIYVFKAKVLDELLEGTKDTDFGGDVIPHAMESHKVFGYSFDGYWEDIGTIRSFYETNLQLALPNPPFNFHDPSAPIFSRARFLPGSTIDGATMENVLLADGCQIGQAIIRDSVIGLRSRIADSVKINRSIIMGADYLNDPDAEKFNVPLGIGEGCKIDKAIIDKNARIGANVIIRAFPDGTEMDNEEEGWVVRDGIVVIPKNTMLSDGTEIGPKD